MKHAQTRNIRILVGVCCAALALALITMVIARIGERMDEQEMKLLDAQVRRAAASCYAAEGRYPQQLEHLKTHYGLVYDEESYVVYYDAFASNVMPDIDVCLKGDERL